LHFCGRARKAIQVLLELVADSENQHDYLTIKGRFLLLEWAIASREYDLAVKVINLLEEEKLIF
jgi:hypothetical protein